MRRRTGFPASVRKSPSKSTVRSMELPNSSQLRNPSSGFPLPSVSYTSILPAALVSKLTESRLPEKTMGFVVSTRGA